MSSTERAPEPTMEEILASIRRIISDDETNSTQQRATSSEYAEQVRVEDADYEAADTQMIADIERALGGVQAAEPAPVEDDLDDILDLTEPGGAAPEDVMMADEEPITVLEEVVLETEITEIYEEPRPKLDFSTAFPPSEQPAEMVENLTEAVESFAEFAPAYEQPEPSYPEPTYDEPAQAYEEPAPSFVEETVILAEMPASEPPVAAQAAPSLDDPTTALERAIAALKAGDLAAFAREAQAGSEAPDPVYVPPAPIYATPEPEAPTVAEPAIEPEVPSFEPEPEPEIMVMDEEEAIVLAEPDTEFEPSTPSWQAESPSWSDVARTAEPEPEPEPEFEPEPEPAPWRSEGMSWRGAPPANEFELNPARVNGGRDHEPHDYVGPQSSKSLEDSVKEMLRPMLKQWLDENMQRVLTAALREELENSDMRRGG
jgi:cell pole-organizing protein PopZ